MAHELAAGIFSAQPGKSVLLGWNAFWKTEVLPVIQYLVARNGAIASLFSFIVSKHLVVSVYHDPCYNSARIQWIFSLLSMMWSSRTRRESQIAVFVAFPA